MKTPSSAAILDAAEGVFTPPLLRPEWVRGANRAPFFASSAFGGLLMPVITVCCRSLSCLLIPFFLPRPARPLGAESEIQLCVGIQFILSPRSVA